MRMNVGRPNCLCWVEDTGHAIFFILTNFNGIYASHSSVAVHICCVSVCWATKMPSIHACNLITLPYTLPQNWRSNVNVNNETVVFIVLLKCCPIQIMANRCLPLKFTYKTQQQGAWRSGHEFPPVGVFFFLLHHCPETLIYRKICSFNRFRSNAGPCLFNILRRLRFQAKKRSKKKLTNGQSTESNFKIQYLLVVTIPVCHAPSVRSLLPP